MRYFILLVFFSCALFNLSIGADGVFALKETIVVDEILKFHEQAALLENTLEIEQKAIGDLEIRLGLMEKNRLEFDSKVNFYTIQLSTSASQLHLPDEELKVIEKAFMKTQATMKSLMDDLTALKGEKDLLKQTLEESYEKKISNDNFLVEMLNADFQLTVLEESMGAKEDFSGEKDESSGEPPPSHPVSELEMSPPSSEPAIGSIKVLLRQLQTTLIKKMLLLQSLDEVYIGRIAALEAVKEKYGALGNEFETRIKNARKSELLTRNLNPLNQQTWHHIENDLRKIYVSFFSIADGAKWKEGFRFLWLSGSQKLLSFLLVLSFLVWSSFRTRKYLKRLSATPAMAEKYWTELVINIFYKHLLLILLTVYFYVCINFKLFFTYSITANIIVQILIVQILILWHMDFFKGLGGKYSFIPLAALIRFLKVLNLVAISYLVIANILKSDSSVLILYRLFWEFSLYLWFFSFSKKMLEEITATQEKYNQFFVKTAPLLKKLFALIVFVGLALELLGYGGFTLYWYSSWGKTMAVFMWSGLILAASREWLPRSSPALSDPSENSGLSHFSMVWMGKQICCLFLFFFSIMALFLSWGSIDIFFPQIYMVLTYSFKIGSMSFSIISLFQMIIILVFTHFMARLWRHYFHQNFLGKSGLDRGLQESITSISIYVIWIFGIFVSLTVFGLNATTLTVAFGALGIGIGFGLQNIFNNFISGLILLFERPIQVGNDIELNGKWATVQKINVRSTIVQTYDNATIIIPNSEFISNQVVNWSFKDKRLRRNIVVGVEYGADIELVKETLLEIAASTPRVLRAPEPSVVFNDFGDSALVFTLRIWSFIDFFLEVETDIRFKIDKLFKERGLVIAFPQQDIHIKSVPPGLFSGGVGD